jgi:hypothetical protein
MSTPDNIVHLKGMMKSGDRQRRIHAARGISAGDEGDLRGYSNGAFGAVEITSGGPTSWNPTSPGERSG